ncbi:hypothetical protein [Agrobacterium pusense]|uniref:hypothetical protein n=1 Tax=Agrobacterium pusense TaxID=648995 RepID=UPI0022B90E61|nr:hypothetical protein [Agrobacterium pusense]MCZ7926177.1 hypothetical protein [Agrobacterium pusense]
MSLAIQLANPIATAPDSIWEGESENLASKERIAALQPMQDVTRKIFTSDTTIFYDADYRTQINNPFAVFSKTDKRFVSTFLQMLKLVYTSEDINLWYVAFMRKKTKAFNLFGKFSTGIALVNGCRSKLKEGDMSVAQCDHLTKLWEMLITDSSSPFYGCYRIKFIP